jgi:hypothetical protein
MSRPILVFLGPTLDRDIASRHLEAIYRPPAEQGSLVLAVSEFDPRLIILIDGCFASVPAVRHKEILWVLSRGVRVVGAASVGALRAAELASLGMEGHGLIYRWYRATPFADDDEVAVAMTPPELGAQPLSDALINIRLTLRHAERHGLISRADRHRLCDLARSLHFVERCYAVLFARARSALELSDGASLDALERWVMENAIDQKRVDALSLLNALAAPGDAGDRAHGRAHAPAGHAFELTESWLLDLEAAGIDTTSLSGS